MKSEAATIARALASAITFAAIPLLTNVALVAHNIFVVGSFNPKFGPWGAFNLARDVLLVIWFLNAMGFLLTSAALRLLGSPRAALLSAALAGLVLAGVVLADPPVPFQAWFAAGPVGAVLAVVLTRFLERRQAAALRRVHPNHQP